MIDYKKGICEDMKLFIFEWIIKHPAEGKGIKYVRNLNKEELIKACLFIEGKITKEVLMEEVIIPKQEYFRKSAQRRALKKKGYASDDEADDEDNEADDEDNEADDEDNEADDASKADEDEDKENASDTEEEDEE
jgi:hypothetical protein